MKPDILAAGKTTTVINDLCLTAANTVPKAVGSVKGMKNPSDPADWSGDSTTGWKSCGSA